MKTIKIIVEDIQEELEGAEHYAKLATQYKDEDRVLADTYARLAEIELGHANALHEQAVRIIKEYKSAGNQSPVAMQAVWDWEHKKAIDTTAMVKQLLAMYKGA